MSYWLYTVRVRLWEGTDLEREDTVPGSLQARRPPSDRKLREFIRSAYRIHNVPVRILDLKKHFDS